MKIRLPFVLLALLAVATVAPAPSADADPIRCTCRDGNACYHYLNAPVDPPDDPCNCPQCRAAPGTCPKKLPPGWDPICASNDRMECFLRRHAASWRLSCSERLSGTCECKNPHPEFCPYCGKDGEEWDAEGLERVKRQVEIESRILGNPRNFVIVISPHFYVVTDIRSLKIRTQNGSPRIMRTHEIAHVFAQRAEIAWHQFWDVFGVPQDVPRPFCIFLLDKRRTQEDVQEAYFGNPRTGIVYGGPVDRISGGFPYNGFAVSLQDCSGDDYTLHLRVRHCIGHLLISVWKNGKAWPPELPNWLYAGPGHWLARSHPNFGELATFCGGEGDTIKRSGKKWEQKIRKMAADRDLKPIQRIFDSSWEDLDFDDHVRIWSWFDLFLAEDRERFVRFMGLLRTGVDHRTAMKQAFGCSPEEFDQRWRDRVLGKRPTVAATPAELDAANPDRPGAAERAAIRNETDPGTLAARIRALGTISDPLTAATILPHLASDSPNVRERIVLCLSATRDASVREWLRTEGLATTSGVVRAYVARILGNLGDAEAGPELAKYLDDGLWFTRAHAALAIGKIGYEPAKEKLKEMVGDSSPKVRIAAMDALGRFGEKAASAWEPVSEELGDSAWQVRSAAADCLGALGDMHAVDALIDRMEIESGRVRRDIREALKRITRDDLGNNPKYWRDWWEKQKEKAGGNVPPRGEKPKEPPKGEHDYGQTPTYYGIRVFSQGIGYVLDVSSSMVSRIKLDPGWLKRNDRDYPPEAKKFDLARSEIEASLKSLDPRTRFNLYYFRGDAFSWKDSLVPATPSNIDSAVGRMAAEEPPPPDQTRSSGKSHLTNYVDAFRLALDVREGAEVTGRFGDTPDTIFFLTDGQPTSGDITEPDALLSWFSELNLFARVKVNVITFGRLGSDPAFLRSLAEDNGGTFVLVPEAGR